MGGNGIKPENILLTALQAVLISFVVILIIGFVLALIIPFILWGPNDDFWQLLLNQSGSYEGEIVGYYLNMLQWLARLAFGQN